MNDQSVCEWFTDDVKKLNDMIWYPHEMVENTTFRYPFDSKLISHKSFKNSNDTTNSLTFKDNTNTKKEKYRELNMKYENTTLRVAQELIDANKKHLQLTLTPLEYEIYKDVIEKINIIESEKIDSTEKTKRIIAIIKQNFKNANLDDECSEYHKPTALSKLQNQYKAEKQKLTKPIRMIYSSLHAYKYKIEFDNKQKSILYNWLEEAIKVYNKCVDCFNAKDPKMPSNYMHGKKYIFTLIYGRTDSLPCPYDILAYEVKTFYENLSSCYTNYQNGNIIKFEMKHKNVKKHQTITIYKNCINKNGIYINKLKKVLDFGKHVNCDNFECDCKLTYEKSTDSFYIYIPQYIQHKLITDRKDIVAIDPGEKVPFTYYSLNECGFIGDDIRVLILKKENKIRNYQRLLNKKRTRKGNRINKNKIIKKIDLEYKKIKGIVNELHKKTALFLCRNYNIILLPKFETQNMLCDTATHNPVVTKNSKEIKDETKLIIKTKVKDNYEEIKNNNKDNVSELRVKLKSYRRQRRLNSRVKFVLNQLSHYKFKQHLLSKAKEYGCLCDENITEEYTSQLCAKCGHLSKTYIGRTKKCAHCGSEINRDINGSRNILLKYILKYLVKLRAMPERGVLSSITEML